MIGCIGLSQEAMTTPPLNQDNVMVMNDSSDLSDNRYLTGFYNIAYNAEDNSAEVIPVRDAEKHWNVLKFLEKGPCEGCVQVQGVTPNPDGTKIFFTVISHPFSNPLFTGFDVRGYTIFRGSHTFTDTGLTAPDRYQGDGFLVNADGYSTLYNASTIPFAPLEGYLKGKFATPTTPNADLNGFRAHVSALGGNNPRRILEAGDNVGTEYVIDMPDGDFIFGYAVDASWIPPTTSPVTDPENDFPPGANCPEPYWLEAGWYGSGLTDMGGKVQLILNVYDHSGLTSYLTPTVECPELLASPLTMNFDWDNGDYQAYYLNITNQNQAPIGKYNILFTVEDTENATSPAHLNLTTYQILEMEVRAEKGYARTWGGDGFDSGYGIGLDLYENVYITGYFDASSGGTDFDPGPDTDIHMSNGLLDCFISKYDPEGNYLWTITFGGSGIDTPYDIYVEEEGNILVCGLFTGLVQFDPTNGLGSRQSLGGTDGFLARYNSDGVMLWVSSWGGSGNEAANSVVYNGWDTFVAGSYESTADFDPNPSVDNKTAVGKSDAYVSIYDYSGNYVKTLVWGGLENDTATAVAGIQPDIYAVAGWWEGSADLDPGPGTQFEVSSGFQDGYLLYIYQSTDTLFSTTLLQGAGPVIPYDMSYDLYNTDGVYLAGAFNNTVDFDQVTGPDIRTSNGIADAFLLKQDNSGAHQWVRTWGDIEFDSAFAVTVAKDSQVYTGGSFGGTVDFDPGTGSDILSSFGLADAFVSSYNAAGDYLWTNTFGSNADNDHVFKLTSFSDTSCFATGPYSGTTDFYPGPDMDDHITNGITDVYIVKYEKDGSW